jgi:hypothetical protein
MKRQRLVVSASILLAATWLTTAWMTPGCGGGETGAGNGANGGNAGSGGSHTGDGGGSGGSGGSIGNDDSGLNECGHTDPSCTVSSVGPAGNPPKGFPLPSDDPPPDNVDADGVTRDTNGYITLDSTKAQFDFLWIADDLAYGVGMVSKVRTTPYPTPPYYREVARYVSFTCQSDPVNGGKEGITLGYPAPAALCADGVHGCCARDEVVPGPNGGHQAVNVFNNRPSRTAVDTNGDVWVANRAFGLQSSVTKIANNIKSCIDRNGNGAIETSSDVNNDGIITTDCDLNNQPDDGSTACAPGMSHEFWGLDDECILFTTNTGDKIDLYGRPLALGPGESVVRAYGPSDAWAGTFQDGKFYRIDGKSGEIKTTVQIEPRNGVESHPYGAAVDSHGILWAPNVGGTALFYFDTNDPSKQGMVQHPFTHGGFYGIAIDGYEIPDPNGGDPVQVNQIWLGDVGGSGAFRYRPDRTNGFDGLGQGTWAYVGFTGGPPRGRGIGVDNRKPTAFAWVALDGYDNGTIPNGGRIGRIPTDVPDGEQYIDFNTNTFALNQQITTGAGVAFDLDIWGINQDSSSASHLKVDAAGNVVGPPDLVPLDDKPNDPELFCGSPAGYCKPHPYTYSDFTGFGLRNFTIPSGYYAWTEEGCGGGAARWLRVEWTADVPTGAKILVSMRSSDDLATIDAAPWTGEYDKSPADLSVAPGPLAPNPARYMEVLFKLSTNTDQSPKLKSFKIVYDCPQDAGPK